MTRGPGVSASVSEYPSARHVPSSYPGRAPSSSYLLLDDLVIGLSDGTAVSHVALDGDGSRLDDVLLARGEAALADRIPVLAYGANRCPGSLAVKMDHYGYRSPGSGLSLPTLAVGVGAADIVWGGLSEQGYAFADILPDEKLGAEELALHLNLLDKDQFRVMNESEGVGSGLYSLALIGPVTFSTGQQLDEVLCYAGPAAAYVSTALGQPLAVAPMQTRHRRLPACSTIEAMQLLIEENDLFREVQRLLGINRDQHTAARLSDAMNAEWWSRRRGAGRDARVHEVFAILWAAFRSRPFPRTSLEAFAGRGRLVQDPAAAAERFRLGDLLATA